MLRYRVQYNGGACDETVVLNPEIACDRDFEIDVECDCESLMYDTKMKLLYPHNLSGGDFAPVRQLLCNHVIHLHAILT